MQKLAIIASVGLGVAALCVVGVAVMGARGLGGEWSDLRDLSGSWHDRDTCRTSDDAAQSRSLSWDGGDAVTIKVPSVVHYRRDAGPRLEVTGDPMLLSHLELRDGRITLNCRLHNWQGKRLDITLPGREINDYTIAGLTDLDLQKVNQDRLDITVAGKGKVTGDGKVGDLKIEILGRTDAYLRDLIASRVRLRIMGRGDVETSPIEDADITIMGRGDVSLYTEPAHLDTSIMGKGNIKHLARQD